MRPAVQSSRTPWSDLPSSGATAAGDATRGSSSPESVLRMRRVATSGRTSSVGEFMSTMMKGRVHENPHENSHDGKKLKKSLPSGKTPGQSLGESEDRQNPCSGGS